MRKSLTTISLMLLYATGYSQFTKGTITLGGELGYEHTTLSPNDKTFLSTVNTFSVSPEAGVFFVPNLMTGLLLSYNYTSFKPGNENQFLSDKIVYNIYGAGVFVRYYYNYFFCEGRYELGSSKSKQENGGVDSETKYHNTQFGIGYSYLISKEIAIEPKLSYRLSTSGDGDANKSNVLVFTVGIRAYINRNRAE